MLILSVQLTRSRCFASCVMTEIFFVSLIHFQTSTDGIYLSRHIGLKLGIPVPVPALTVNRLCGSGFQAIINGAQVTGDFYLFHWPPVCCNTTSVIAHIHRTNKTISVSLTNANSKRDGLVFLSLISFPLHNSNTRVKIQRAKIQPHRGKMDNSFS